MLPRNSTAAATADAAVVLFPTPPHLVTAFGGFLYFQNQRLLGPFQVPELLVEISLPVANRSFRILRRSYFCCISAKIINGDMVQE